MQQRTAMIEIMSTAEVRRITGLNERTIRKMVENNQIPGAFRAGRVLRFKRRAFEKWLAGE